MAGDIKGITIEFRGNATGLNKAIREVNSNIRTTQRELTSINKALKFNPTSVDLWRQKQDLLKQKIKQTEQDLNDLKRAQKQMQADGVDRNSEAYRRLEREIIETTSKLKTFKSQLRSIGNANLHALGEGFKEAGKKIESAGQKLRGLSTAAAAAATAIGALTVKSASTADEINTMSSRYSIATKDLQKYALAADLVDVGVEDIAKTHIRLEKSMLTASKGTGSQAEAFEKLGVSVTDADGALRDGDTVWNETIAALGKMTNETERDALAMQLMGKSASALNPLIEDGGEQYKKLTETMKKYGLDFIDQETLDRANDFRDELDTIKAIGSIAFMELGTELAAYLAPALEKVVDYVGRFANWLSTLDPEILAIVAAIAGVLAVLAPVLIYIGKLSTGIGALISFMGILAPMIGTVIAAIGTIAVAIGPVILIIGALIAAGVLLYKHWDQVKAFATSLGQHIAGVFAGIHAAITAKINAVKAFLSSAWEGIKTGVRVAFAVITSYMTSPFTTAFNTIKAIINKIKGMFPLKLGKMFNLKLPHFKVSGGKAPWGIGGKGSMPHWSVDWYAKGGIFNSPSIIGVGEAGKEAVVPLDTLWNKLDNIAAASASSGGGIVININGANKDPQAIAQEVKKILIDETNRRRLAWQ